MQRAGGIITLVAGIFGVLAAGATLMVGGIGSLVKATDAETVVWLGWGGVLFSFACIVLGAIAMNAQSRWPGAFIIVCAVAGAALGGTLVAIFMALALVGGILVAMARQEPRDTTA